jgi:hypothetical protein
VPTAVGASTRPGLWDLRAVDLRLVEYQSLGVHQGVSLPASRTFLFPSYPLCSAPTPLVFADWESAIPALGSGFLPKRTRSRSPDAALSCSKVPSTRHLPNHH